MGSLRSFKYSSTVREHHHDAAYTYAFPCMRKKTCLCRRGVWMASTSTSVSFLPRLASAPRSSGAMACMSKQSTSTFSSVTSSKCRVTDPSLSNHIFQSGDRPVVPFLSWERYTWFASASHVASNVCHFLLLTWPAFLLLLSPSTSLHPPCPRVWRMLRACCDDPSYPCGPDTVVRMARRPVLAPNPTVVGCCSSFS